MTAYGSSQMIWETSHMKSEASEPILLHKIFERQATLTPSKIAVEHPEKNIKFTYAEIEERANYLAAYLCDMGMVAGEIVAIYLPRGPEQYITMLAIMKAGGAYLPIDTELPTQRIQYILDDASINRVITCKILASCKAIKGRTQTVIEDVTWNNISLAFSSHLTDNNRIIKPTDLCYVIYTSGTAGHPKGVGISHLNAVTFVNAIKQIYGVRNCDRILQGFSTSFDASVEEIWMAFSSGATLVVATLETMREIDLLPAKLREFGITVFSTVPTVMRIMNQEEIPQLRFLLLGGEATSENIITKWAHLDRKIFNGYGPTECSVVSTYDWCEVGAPVTIGKPLPGYELAIFGEDGKEIFDDRKGELCIGGTGVSLRGYFNRPELNEEKFFQHKGVRFYRTGDLVRRNDQGKLIYIGRIDSQVKSCGYRIELEEIEAQLNRIVDCEGVIVSTQMSVSNAAQLIAYFIDRQPLEIDLQDVLSSLRQKLPIYMIPSHFVQLLPQEVPLLKSGKVNRRALPPITKCTPLSINKDMVNGLYRTYHNETEIKLMEIWHDVLGTSVSTDVSFFDYGGDSVQAAMFIAECREDKELSMLTIRDVYSFPTIRELAKCLELKKSGSVSPDSYDKLARLQNPSTMTKNEQRSESCASLGRYQVSKLQYTMCTSMQMIIIMFLIIVTSNICYELITEILHLKDWFLNTSKTQIILTLSASVFLMPPVFLSGMFAIGLLFKWLIVGRFKEADYPLWSWGYFHWWLVRLLLAPMQGVATIILGTPLASIFYRLLGAKIGKSVYLGSILSEFDLVSIGDGASISPGVKLRTYSIEGGILKLRRIHIGKNVFVGSQSVVCGGAILEDDSKLHHLACLTPDSIAPKGTEWCGSPATQVQPGKARLSRLLKRHEENWRSDDIWTSWKNATRIQLLQFLYQYWYGLMALIPFGLQVLFLIYLEIAFDAVLTLNLSILLPCVFVLSVISFFGRLTLIIIAKWIMTGRAKAGTIPLNSLEYVRRWFCTKLMEKLVSPAGTRGVTETLLMPHICRLLGMKVGKNTEISDAAGFHPDLITLGDESMIADRSVIGVPIVHRGRMTLGKIKIGNRTFIGNAAHIPITTRIVKDQCLIGVLSLSPDEMDVDTDWLGSPPFHLPNRIRISAPENKTFNPPAHLYLIRAFFNFWKMILPNALVYITLTIGAKIFVLGYNKFDVLVFYGFLFILVTAILITLLLLPIISKWLLVGKYRSEQRPLWTCWMWRMEIAYEIERRIIDFFGAILYGTALYNCWYRLMGAKIDARVCIYDGGLMESDLVNIKKDVSIEGFLQTHLFEDRVMKLGPIDIEHGCSIGSEACALYDSKMGANSALGDLSLIMKNERFLPHRKYIGIPAENAS
jgi:non-ribosomal peptide synthetase-like protein